MCVTVSQTVLGSVYLGCVLKIEKSKGTVLTNIKSSVGTIWSFLLLSDFKLCHKHLQKICMYRSA